MGCIFGAQIDLGCIFGAQIDLGCIFGAPISLGCIFGAQINLGCIFGAQTNKQPTEAWLSFGLWPPSKNEREIQEEKFALDR